MANLNADRGQLLLVSAVGITLLLVSLTAVLNTAIFAENLATRGGVDDGAVLQFRTDAVAESEDLLTYVNRHNDSSYGALSANYTAFLGGWSALVERHAAAEGGAYYVDVRGVTNGTRVVQSNAGLDFTNTGGDAKWDLVADATGVRNYRLTVSRTTLVDADEQDDDTSQLVGAGAFAVVVDTGSDRWRVFVYQDGSDDVLVAVGKNGLLQGTCRVGADAEGDAVADLSNASVNDQPCSPLDTVGDPLAGTDGQFDLTYNRSVNAGGTYQFVVDRQRSAVTDGDYAPLDGRSPNAEYALYAAEVELGYVTPTVRVRETVRVVPSASDD